ncbi:MAG: hypothetical protein AB1384_08150 [Actinomycetota bacterium]
MEDLKEKLDNALLVSDEVGEKVVLVHDERLCEIYYDLREVPEAWHFPLWEIYDRTMDLDTIQDQRCYDQQSFIEALIDPDYLKIVMLVDRAPVGLTLGTFNLEKARVAYINPEYLRKRYPEAVRDGKLFYLTSGCFAEEVQHTGILPYYIAASIRSIYENSDIFVADVSDATYYMKDAIIYFLRLSGVVVSGEEILGQQTYFALLKS